MQRVVNWFQLRVIKPVVDVLNGGVSPSVLALSIAAGVAAGIFPIPGVTSVIAVFFGFVLPVNLVLVQTLNLLLTVPDIALVPMFVTVGGYIMGNVGEPFSVSTLMEELGKDMIGGLFKFQAILIQAVLAWALLMPFAMGIMYVALLPVCRIYIRNRQRSQHKPRA